MRTESYMETGDRAARKWPRSYDKVIAKPCPRCGAKPLQMCNNPLTVRRGYMHRAKVPCIARFRPGLQDEAA